MFKSQIYLHLQSMTSPTMCQLALFSLTGEELTHSASSSDGARIDIAARGYWQRCEKAFFDVRVFNPYASTHRRQTLSSSFNANELEKKGQSMSAYSKWNMAHSHRSSSVSMVAAEEGHSISSLS